MATNDPNVTVGYNAENNTDKATDEVKKNLKDLVTNYTDLRNAASDAWNALKGIGEFLLNLAKEGAQAAEQADKLAFALKKNSDGSQEMADALIEQASALQQVTGYGGDEIVNAQTRLALTKLNADQIRLLTPALLDTAEGLRNMGEENANLNEIADNFSKALSGNDKALKKLKVELNPVEAELFKTGTTTQRVQILTEKLRDSFGGMADEQGKKFTQTVSIADQAMGDFQETLGQQFSQNETVLNSILKTSEGWNSLTDVVNENKDAIGASIDATIAVFVAFGNSIKLAFNVASIAVKESTLVIIKAAELSNLALSKITTGETSEKFKKLADDAKKYSFEWQKSVVEDARDMRDAVNGITDPIGSLKPKMRQSSKDVTDAAKSATETAKNSIDEIRVKQEEDYKADKERRSSQISDIKTAEEEKVRQIKSTAASIKQQDDEILAEKLKNANDISTLLKNQLSADKGALIAYTQEKKNYTTEELTAAKTSLQDIEKAARDHYKTLIGLAEEHKNKAIAAQKAIEDNNKSAEDKIREIKRAAMSEDEVNADKQKEIQQKTAQLRELSANPNTDIAAIQALGKELQNLTASQAQAASAASKTTGDTYTANQALRQYEESVKLTNTALSNYAADETRRQQEAEKAASQPKATADTARAQIEAVYATLRGGKPLTIVPDVAPAVQAINAEIAKIPDTKTIQVIFDNEGRKIGYSELLTNQTIVPPSAATQAVQTTGQTNAPLQTVTPSVTQQQIPVKGDVNVNVNFAGIESLPDTLKGLIQGWALEAVQQQLKNDQRTQQ